MQTGSDDDVAGPVPVTTRAVWCDGYDGADGHPRVYLRIVNTDIRCPYCSRHFVLQPGGADTAH